MKKTMGFMLMVVLILSYTIVDAEGLDEWSLSGVIEEEAAETEESAEGLLGLAEGLSVGVDGEDMEENPFGELRELLEEEQKQEETKLKQLAFNCNALNSLGECTLYKTSYSFRDGRYNVYLFSDMNKSLVDDMIAFNRDQRYYETESLEEDGIQYYLMTQYGENGIKLVIAPDFLGYTMVMIDDHMSGMEQPTTEQFTFPQICQRCEGEGECVTCEGNGKCQTCEGPGYSLCSYCCIEHMGRTPIPGGCPHCGGTGYRVSGDYMRSCSACIGTGNCSYCDGKGYNENRPCWNCKGSDECQACSGSGQCPDCYGKGQK